MAGKFILAGIAAVVIALTFLIAEILAKIPIVGPFITAFGISAYMIANESLLYAFGSFLLIVPYRGFGVAVLGALVVGLGAHFWLGLP